MLTHRLNQFFSAQPPKCLYRLTNLLEFLSVNFPTTLDYHSDLLFKRSVLLGCVFTHAHATLPKGHLIVYSYFATKKNTYKPGSLISFNLKIRASALVFGSEILWPASLRRVVSFSRSISYLDNLPSFISPVTLRCKNFSSQFG